MSKIRVLFFGSLLTLTLLFTQVLATHADAPALLGAEKAAAENNCSLLDNPAARERMGGMFETKLLLACGRANELGQVSAPMTPETAALLGGVDVQVNNSTGETGTATTQSETTIAVNENTGTICSGYNDGYSGVVQGQGYTGFSRSTDGGASFVDGGALGSRSFGDPSLVWRKSDGYFYFAALDQSGLGIWRSTNDCASFQFHALIHSGGGDDKELMAVDNTPASPHYGRLYVAWTDFNAGARIFSTYSDNGTNWSTPVALSASGVDVQGAWPTVAPNGDVYVGWVRWNPYSSGPIDIEIARSTNGGVSYSLVTNPMTGQVNPRAATPTASCGRPALNGNIRYLPSPQIAVGPNGNLHAIYSYDPDGYNTGDVVNVYYRRSTDNGATWQPEILLNDDGTTRDQYQPTLSVSATGRVVAGWYDRRNDGNNLLFQYYIRVSEDGGVTWQPSQLISDVQSPIYLDPNLATCYHGDYDTQTQVPGFGYIQWSDDRNVVSGHQDPDVWFDKQAFSPDFTLDVTPANRNICVPNNAVYNVAVGQVLGFTDPVALSASGVPTGYNPYFSTNPVIPPGTSYLVLAGSSAAPGSYTIDVSGTSTTGTKTKSVDLNLFTAAPGASPLVYPMANEQNVSVTPTFDWDAPAQGLQYLIIVKNLTTGQLVYGVTTDTSYTFAAPLDTLTNYLWSVRAYNACGAGSFSAPRYFRTQEFAPVCPPDAYGYSCTDSNSGPVSYNFEDISGTGTSLTLGDDQVSVAIPTGFTFNYYGTDYTSIYVSSNGFLTVNAGSSSGCCSGQQLPNSATPNGVISGWWEDLNPAAGGTIHYQTLGTAPNQRFVVQFTNVPHYPSGNLVTMEFKLFANSNNVEVHYMNAPSDGGNHSAGIENQGGTVGLSYYYGNAPLASSLAVCYLYPGYTTCGNGVAVQPK
ncbi:MAG: exo-alpha-sialidase [Ardenticatenales bacterium]|nr:exo-alpha-sialidase [Ardenticatenales bacterium]